ncbi:MAG: hypothetical protein LC115_06885 [Bacteroidia bacterium]|nr:hypothetical protein [Bacteroidia bacterium]
MGRIIAILLFYCGFLTNAFGQYHLTEIGASAGAGANLPTDNAKIHNGISWNIQSYLSHYICGKMYGYHGALGYRGFLNSEEVYQLPSILGPKTYGTTKFAFHYLDAGFYFKLRRHNYHRPKEACLLIGPQFNILLAATANGQAYRSDDWRRVYPAVIGIHISTPIRISFFFKTKAQIEPALEYFFTKNAKNISDRPASLQTLSISLNLKIRLWDNR